MGIIRETAAMSETERMAVRNSNFQYRENIVYIVESGTSGIWSYRKWSDGTAECWGYATISVLCSNQSGDVYCSDIKRVALPDGLFTGATIANANCTDVWSWVGPVSSYSAFVDLKIYRGSNYAQAYNTGVYLSVKGRWK